MQFIGHVVAKQGDIVLLDSHNLVTLVFRSGLASWFTGSALSFPTAVAYGTGTASATSISASGLQFEIGRVPIFAAGVVGGYTARFSALIQPTGATGTIREFGLFTHLSANSAAMFAIISANIPKGTASAVDIVWDLVPFTGSAL